MSAKMELECFMMNDTAPQIVPGRSDRDWMDAFGSRFPYRCLPLVMANTSGWEILCPHDFTVEWNGGPAIDDVVIYPDDMMINMSHLVTSHFTRGIITFHTGYMFRTPPGWAIWASGAPNQVKDGISALTGLIETDWLPFPFTMNWIMTRPGRVHFKKDEPFCFIHMLEHKKMDEVQPVIRNIRDEPELEAQYRTWAESRLEFNAKLAAQDAQTTKAGWQKNYFNGTMPNNIGEAPPDHMNRRRLKVPKPKKA